MYEAVIGLEIHAQLLTASKLFCGCAALSGDQPNTRTCPVCLGLPGALPTLNARAVDQAVLAALALGCTINPESVFARKNYFYPDLPKGYQITQYDRPLAADGALGWRRHGQSCRVGIVRVHLEEDAGKSLHEGFPDSDQATYIDYNRSGVPLAEIVTAPDLRSADAAAEFFRQLRAVLVEAGVSDGNLEAGNLRCDANVSVRPAGGDRLGDRTEIKNLNSFRFLQRALAYEVQRQSALVDGGGRVESCTMLWDDRRGVTVQMRSKEDAREYRYFPEPDLPPLRIDEGRLAAIAQRLPELPHTRADRLRVRYGLGEEDAAAIGASAPLSRYFEEVAAGARPTAAAQWVRGELARRLHETGQATDAIPVAATHLARLLALVDDGTVSVTAAKQVFARIWGSGEGPDAAIADMGLVRESDPSVLRAWIDAVIAEHPAVVAQHHAGRRGALGFLVGQVLRKSGGRANPGLVDQGLRDRLAGEDRA
jgi:aspartyl-tRNA(Asn)/glutamyl-tRNA(Gln) amidotransferase subunit B